MNDDLIAEADEHLDSSYELLKNAISLEGNLDDSIEGYNGDVEEYLDNLFGDVMEGISSYKQYMEKASERLDDADPEEENVDAEESIVEAGQMLVNAYRDASILFNKGHSALENGGERLDNPFTSVDMDEASDYIGMVNNAVDLKEDAFAIYDSALSELGGELVDRYMQQGVMMHLDVGIGQQEPE